MAFLNGVDSSTQELLDAQTHIWNHIFNFINLSLKCAIELGIPDVIHKHGKPMTHSELTDALAINEAKYDGLHRLMQILVHSKFFDKAQISKDKEDEEEGYCLTQASRLLLRDEPMNAIPMALLVLDPTTTAPWHHMSRWFQNDDSTSFVTAHGRTIWEHAGSDPRYNKLFNEAMVSHSRIVNSVLVKECKQVFEGLDSMVDVGGCTGETAKSVVGAFPGLRCIVLDLPHVVDGMEGSENLRFVGGDMFESIPHADAVFLKEIITYKISKFHKKNNSSGCYTCSTMKTVLKVLKRCKEAITRNKMNSGKVIVVDIAVGDDKDENRTATETQLLFDMQMVAQLGGKERTEKEWAKIFSDAGFGNYKITHALGLRSIIEVFP